MPSTQTLKLQLRRRENFLRRLVKSLAIANQRHCERKSLARLDPHLLRDIGLDPHMVAKECAKPFWRD